MVLSQPPPWADVGKLLRTGIYMYIALVALAIVSAAARYWFLLVAPVTVPAPFSQPSKRTSAHLYRDMLGTYSFHIALVRLLFASFICVAYVYITYIGSIARSLWYVLKTIGAICSVYVTSVVATSDRPLNVIANMFSVVEVMSLSSMLFAKRSDWLNFSFLQAYTVMSSYLTLEPAVDVYLNFKSSQVQRQLARRAIEFLVFIYVFACGLQLFERMGEPWGSFTATTFELTLANSFYFTVVTLFTVGYGDFVPFTLLGRLWIIFIIVFGAYLISRKIGQVVDVVSDLRRGRGSFVKAEGTEHCVICGHVKWEYLKSFVQEFYEDERNHDKKLVVICDRPNWTEDTWSKFSATHPKFRQHVTYLEGTCVLREDLVRAQVETALAVFVLCNQHNADPYAEDSETLKRILTLRSYTPNRPVYAMCALRDSMLQISFALEHLDENEALQEGVSRRPSMDMMLTSQRRRDSMFDTEDVANNATMRDFSDDDDDDDGLLVHSYDGSSDLKSEAICMQEVEMSLMAENVFCNGLSTLLANLILRIDPINKPTDQPWAVEYKIGSECRFEYVKLPMSLHNRRYDEIALIMYDFGVVLIATKRFMEQKWRAISPDSVLKINTIGLIITFHSAAFLDVIMRHIASRVGDLFEDGDGSDPSSRDVPSVDDGVWSSHDMPGHFVSGGYLAGDLSMTYEFSTDEIMIPYSPNPSVASAIGGWPGTETGPIPVQGGVPYSNQSPAVQVEKTLPEESFEARAASAPPDSSGVMTSMVEHANALVSTSTQPRGGDGAGAAQGHPIIAGAGEVRNVLRDTVVEGEIDGVRDTKRESMDPLSRPFNPGVVGSDFGNRQDPLVAPSQMAVEQRPTKRKPSTHHVTFPTQPPMESSGSLRRARSIRGEPRLSRRRSYETDNGFPAVFFGDEELPMRVEGHIVVCAIGELSVMNLKYFVQRVWTKRGAAEEETPIVAICPVVNEDVETELSSFLGKKLFLIQGNSLSVKTLKIAQFDRARAIVILACEDKTQVEEMDAKAMFTVMTLDYLLGEDSETFVCTMLDAEESMQLLRAPTHCRRMGITLNKGADNTPGVGVTVVRRGSRGASHGSDLSVARRSRSARDGLQNRTLSFGALSLSKALPQSMSFVGTLQNTYTDRRQSITNLVARESFVDGNEMGAWGKTATTSFLSQRRTLGGMEGSFLSASNAFGARRASAPLGFEASQVSMGHGGAEGNPGMGGEDNGGRRMDVTYSRARDESFEKQRYASGEMMISSTFMTLLIREYAMPGLSAIVRKIFGAGFSPNVKSKRSWIRSVSIPEVWLNSGERGQRIYREVFDTLLTHGAIAIGLYRAGDANVRIQVLEGGDSMLSDGAANSCESESFSSYQASIESPDGLYEMGGDSGGVEQRASLVPASRGNSYGAVRADETAGGRLRLESTNEQDMDPFVAMEGSRAEDGRRNREERVDIPTDMLMGIAKDLRRVRRENSRDEDEIEEGDGAGVSDDIEADNESEDLEVVHKYICPNTGRIAYYHEVEGGGNVLPYVYASPEPYTLVSKRDAVYILVAPHITLPETW